MGYIANGVERSAAYVAPRPNSQLALFQALPVSRYSNNDETVIRKAFVMSLKPGADSEYERRHNPIWPELSAVLTAHGVRAYSIFLHAQTRQLFAFAEIQDEARWEAIAETEVCQRWWAHMRELMAVNEDNSPVSVALREVFHFE